MTNENLRLRAPDKFGHWGIEAVRRVPTTDARSRDSILSPLTPAESAANAKRVAAMAGLDLGKTWTGDLKPVGAAVAQVIDAIARIGDKQRRSAAMSDAIAEIAAAAYGGSAFGTSETAIGGDFGSLVFGRPEKQFGSAPTPDELNRMNEEHYSGDRSARAAAKDRSALSTRATVESIGAANKAFWDKQPSQSGRPWGQG
jgi:hypothetical protein